MHEAELVQLKRKWERVVSRSLDRAYAPSPSQPSPVPSSSANTPVLGGIKEGVQGVGRLFAAGFGDLASPSSPGPASPANTTAFSTPIQSARLRQHEKKHVSVQSASSVSTRTTGSCSSSVRLSQSSASSLLSDEPVRESYEESPSSFRPVRYSWDLDVDATSTTALRAVKIHRRKSRDSSPLVSSPVLTTDTIGWDEPPSSPAFTSPASPHSAKLATLTASLPPPSSIPGLGPLTSPTVSSWMESVGSSVGKKWEEIQKGGTCVYVLSALVSSLLYANDALTSRFTKSQKRASLLLSDVSQSLFAALASPTPSPTPFTHRNTHSHSSAPPLSHSALLSPQSPSSVTPAFSLLEDEDAEDHSMLLLSDVLVPDAKAPAPVKPMSLTSITPLENKTLSSNGADDDDEWNW